MFNLKKSLGILGLNVWRRKEDYKSVKQRECPKEILLMGLWILLFQVILDFVLEIHEC